VSFELHPEEVVDTFLINDLTGTELLIVRDESDEPTGNFDGRNKCAFLHGHRQHFPPSNETNAHYLAQDSLNEGDVVVVTLSFREVADKTAYFDYSVSLHAVLLVGWDESSIAFLEIESMLQATSESAHL